MQFAQPLWLLAGAAACALLMWQYRRYDRRQQAALAQFAASRLLDRLTASVSTPRRRLKRMLYTVGVGLLFVALARPQAGFEWQQTHRKGLELIFAVDTSKSMLAQDVKPDRLTRAKLGVTDLVAKLNGDGVGLVAFAGNAFQQCPITLDYDAFRESLDALDVNVIPRGGTNIATAIREAEAVFKTRTAAEKILVLITDGEDLGGEGITAAQTAAKNGVKIFTVGVGNTTGELVPVPSENGGTEFAKDERGELVKSRLDESTLRKIAEATGGMYQPLGTQGEGLATIYEQGLSSFARQDLSSRQAKVPLERFHWALLAALACFVADQLIGARRKERTLRTRRTAKSAGPRPHTAATALLLLGGIASTHAATPQSAEQAYQKGDFAKAQHEYAASTAKEPAKAELHFNTGAAAYKAGDYAQAASGFQQSLKTEQVPVQQGAYFNLGNTQYRLGQKTEKTNAQETIKTWEEAVKSYDAALQIKPDDADAKHNRDLVQRKIEKLKKQEEQTRQDQKDQQQKQDNKDQKGDANDQSNKDQNSGSKDQQQNDKSQQDQSKGQDDAKDKKDGAGDQKNERDAGEDDEKKDPGDTSKEQKDDPKDQKADGQPKPGEEQKDQAPQADAKSGKGEQPKPVDPAEKPSKGEAQAAHDEQPQNGQALEASEERREPGQLTKEEAKQLLDALKNDERKAPAISQQGRSGSQPNDRRILKDW